MTSRPRLHVVTGKGGVGKSTVCTALARAAQRAGHRVLAIELVAPGGLSRALGVCPGAPGEPTPAEPGLWVSYVEGAAALGEYLGRVLWTRRLADAVFRHPAYRAFAIAAPGVRELMAMGKVRDELMQRDGLRRRWDRVVLDAGATGHALQYLRMASATRRTFTSRGRVRREAEKLEALLGDPEQTAVHVVAAPEHMALCEAESLLQRLADTPSLPVGAVFVNRCLPVSPPGFDLELERLDRRGLAGVGTAVAKSMSWYRGWERQQAEHVAAFEQRSGRRVVRLVERAPQPSGELSEGELRALADHVGRACL